MRLGLARPARSATTWWKRSWSRPSRRAARRDALVDSRSGRQAGISHTTVGEIWRAFGLNPWRQDDFKVSPDPDLVEKIRDIVAFYMNPPVAAAVFAVDEKPQIQALNRTAPTLPMRSTTPARATHDYQRNGTFDLFAAPEIATGKVITDIRLRHTSADFVAFLNKVNRNVPADLDVHVILDNLLGPQDPDRPALATAPQAASTSISRPLTGRG